MDGDPIHALQFHPYFQNPAKAEGSEEAIMIEFRKVERSIKSYSEVFMRDQLP